MTLTIPPNFFPYQPPPSPNVDRGANAPFQFVEHALQYGESLPLPLSLTPDSSTSLPPPGKASAAEGALVKPLGTKTPLGTFLLPDSRFDHVHVDIVGPLPLSTGFSYLLTCVDHFSRWQDAFSMRDLAAETVARIFT